MAANKLKAKIEELKGQILELNSKNQVISTELENEKVKNEDILQAKKEEWERNDVIKDETHKIKVDTINLKVESLEQQLENVQDQLDRKELKKLAEAFSEQEELNKKDQKIWLISLCVAAGVLIFYAVWSIFLTANKPISERITYYAIDIILISSVWFCISQFSESTKLKHDYGNRKTLAQSFHNILNNLAEDLTIKNKFIEKTTDILCAPVGTSNKEPILTKKILKDIAEIIGAAKNG